MKKITMENVTKKLPEKFEDCYKSDHVVLNLWKWSKQLEQIGRILMWGLISIGFIISVIVWISSGEFIYFLYIISGIIFGAVINHWAFRTIALLIGALASIVQHNRITANVALFQAMKENGESNNKS